MGKKILISLGRMERFESGRVQLFNGKFYRLYKGQAIRQIIRYENGMKEFTDFGNEVTIKQIYKQVKLIFGPQDKIVAYRCTKGEDLIAKDTSIWARLQVPNSKSINKGLRLYYEQEALEYSKWLRDIKAYCYERFGNN